jgi:hypothetical protein
LNILGACLTTVPAANRLPDFIAGCYQAAGAVRGAKISFWAGIFAIAAALIGLAAVILNTRATQAADRNALRQTRRRIAVAYLAEITSLQQFFKDCDVVGTFKKCAAQNAVIVKRHFGKEASTEDQQEAGFVDPNGPPRFRPDFHPGDHWIKYYQADPTSVGVFDEGLARELVSYCCRMHNELGRLRWLHDMTEQDLDRLTTEVLSQQQKITVKNLQSLAELADKIKKVLAEIAIPPRVST